MCASVAATGGRNNLYGRGHLDAAAVSRACKMNIGDGCSHRGISLPAMHGRGKVTGQWPKAFDSGYSQYHAWTTKTAQRTGGEQREQTRLNTLMGVKKRFERSTWGCATYAGVDMQEFSSCTYGVDTVYTAAFAGSPTQE